MLGIKRTSLQRIMKELELSPYKIQVTQPLNEDHTQRRSEFAQLMLEKLQTGEIDVKKIWFSDEAYFTLDGHPNRIIATGAEKGWRSLLSEASTRKNFLCGVQYPRMVYLALFSSMEL
ncbi:t-complex protein 1 subunit delta [Nephila pilipes]|uniref:T-complex protein 1 subunit delta n=1 Tax=Nephila pilipes TaxID=299642 RepID=A0A8X6TS13_NEPPI|nr:t-complex protein 1 subunit delta [Nephila pilipes]